MRFDAGTIAAGVLVALNLLALAALGLSARRARTQDAGGITAESRARDRAGTVSGQYGMAQADPLEALLRSVELDSVQIGGAHRSEAALAENVARFRSEGGRNLPPPASARRRSGAPAAGAPWHDD